MFTPLLDAVEIQAHKAHVNARGLNLWPQDRPQDLLHIQRFALWLKALPDESLLQHPFYPLALPVDRHFSARMAYYFAAGDYEQADMQLIDECIETGDRVMECGAGAGVTGSLAAKRSGNAVVLVEPNSHMYARIKTTFAANHQQLILVEGAVVPDSTTADHIELGVYDEYWWSSALAPAQADRQCRVRALRFSALLAEYQPTVLLLDIEGGEIGLFPAELPDCLRLIMVEIHTPEIGERATVEVVNRILAQGFRLSRLLAQTWLFVKE